MPSSVIRRGVFVAAIIVVVSAIALVSLPYVASTQLVRNRIGQELSAWTGYRVALGEAPVVEVWPTFRAVLDDVTLSEWGSDATVMNAERMEIDLSAVSALTGDVAFSRIRLVRPVFRLDESEDRVLMPPRSEGGRLSWSVLRAKAASEKDPANPDIASLPSDKVGTLELVDGRVTAGRPGEERSVVTDISGKLTWPALNQSASLSATAIWRGESIKIEAGVTQPLLLLAGSNADTALNIAASPANLKFNGVANLSSNMFVDGDIAFSSPSMRRALEWSRADFEPGTSIGSISIEGKVSGTGQRLKFSDARIQLDGNPGRGVLDLAFAKDTPSIAGTLAFESLNLQSFLAAFTSITRDAQDMNGTIDASFADQLNLDLRLSANTAKAGSIALTDVAATAQLRGGLAVFDISDATAFGGMLQTGVRIDSGPDNNEIEVRFLAENIDAGSFSRAIGMDRLVPEAKGNISLILKGKGRTWDSVFGNSDGSISATFGPGSIAGIDLAAFRKRAGEGGFFALSDVAEGSLPIQSAELKASISRGVARIETAQAVTAGNIISVSGIVPYVGRGLALTGWIGPQEQPSDDAWKPTPSFFVGGSWSTPFISPIPAPMSPG